MIDSRLFVIAALDNGELAFFDFGMPVLPYRSVEERVRWVLEDYAARRDELWSVGRARSNQVLRELLSDQGSEPDRLLALIMALGFLRPLASSGEVARHLQHPDREVRIQAILSVGRIGGLEEMRQLDPFLQDEDREIRRAAIVAVGKWDDPAVLPRLEAAAGHDEELRRLVKESRQRMDAIAGGDADRLVDAIIGTEEYEDLLPLLTATWEQVLARLGDRAREVEIRSRALRLLTLPPIGRARKQLLEIVQDLSESRQIRLQAVAGLGRCRNYKAVEPLIQMLRGDDREFRKAAVPALGLLGSPKALLPLADLWQKDDGGLKPEILLALRRLCAVAGWEWLQERLAGGFPSGVRTLYCIEHGSSLSRTFAPEPVASELDSASADSRRDAVLLLSFFGTQDHAERLAGLAESDEDQEIRRIAAIGGRRLRKQTAPPP